MSENLERKHKHQMIMLEQGNKAWEKICFEFWKDKIIKCPDSWINNRVPKQLREEFSKYCVKRTGQRYKYVMFTINFKEDVDIKIVNKKVDKINKKIWITRSMWCHEWRNEGKGLHIHIKIWLKEGKKTYDCKREIYNTVKNIVGNKMHVNARYSNRDDCFEEYIKGYKEGKLKKNHMDDVNNRDKLGLNMHYNYIKMD